MIQIKKSFFTLLELLVVLLLISLGAALTGVKVKEAYDEQRFLSESQQVLSQLAMAQDLMLIMDADVQVKLMEDPKTKQITSWIDIEKPIKEEWARLIERKVELTSIHSYAFNGRQESPLTLQFSLGNMTKGTLVLAEGKIDDSNQSNQRQFTIDLVGYPSPLGTKSTPPKESDKGAQSQALYPAEVYEDISADIQKNQKI